MKQKFLIFFFVFYFQECSIFLFEKRCAEKLHKPKRKEAVTEILRASVKQLERFRHPKVIFNGKRQNILWNHCFGKIFGRSVESEVYMYDKLRFSGVALYLLVSMFIYFICFFFLFAILNVSYLSAIFLDKVIWQIPKPIYQLSSSWCHLSSKWWHLSSKLVV